VAVEKVYRCDLCGEMVERGQLVRLGVRKLDDRPEDADVVEVGPCCGQRPVLDVIAHGEGLRRVAVDGE
jgi:hypothetical protein